MVLQQLKCHFPGFKLTVEASFVHFARLCDWELQAEGERQNVLKHDFLLVIGELLHILEKFVFCRDFSVALIMIHNLVEQALTQPVKVDPATCWRPTQVKMAYWLLEGGPSFEVRC